MSRNLHQLIAKSSPGQLRLRFTSPKVIGLNHRSCYGEADVVTPTGLPVIIHPDFLRIGAAGSVVQICAKDLTVPLKLRNDVVVRKMDPVVILWAGRNDGDGKSNSIQERFARRR